ncbi:MAG: type I-G CRISPR-associated protein Cas8g1/Csx17 [Solirubrobacteraceae bacterium]
MPELRLTGCRSRPLLGYLKAVGLLRVVARQADSQASARWADGVFELASSLDRAELERFLLQRYAPTPVVSPWNGGSGFFPKDDIQAIRAIESDESERLAPFREAITAARTALAELDILEKPNTKREKPRLLRALRGSLPDSALEWLDAAVVLLGEDTRYPPLLGSGGNDGRYDFANNYAHAVVRALAIGASGDALPQLWLHAALEGSTTPLVKGMSLAHLSRDSSPVNSPQGEADALGNPWELILALEGSMTFAAGAARRHGTSLPGALVAPFTAMPTGAGYGSAVSGESGRAELWLPLWPGWASLAELEFVTREARAQVGRRQARDGLDFVRAAGELGVARGIESFERYAILERAGQSSLAVPVGRIQVRARPAVAALRSLDPWLDRVRSYVRTGCPAAHEAAVRRLERELFAFAESGAPYAADRVVEALGEIESTLAVGERGAEERGLRPLRSVPAEEWLAAADDGSAEFAVAAAVASLRDAHSGSLPAIRDYLHGTGLDDRGRRTYTAGRALVPRRVEAAVRLAAVHARRQLDAERAERSPAFDRGLDVPASLASALALGEIDLERATRLAAGLSLLDFRDAPWRPRSVVTGHVDPAFGLLALAWRGLGEIRLEPRPGWAAQLVAGHGETVLREAVLRLRMAELPPLVEPTDLAAAAPDGVLLAAALLLRIHDRDRRRLASRLLDLERRPTTEGATT